MKEQGWLMGSYGSLSLGVALAALPFVGTWNIEL